MVESIPESFGKGKYTLNLPRNLSGLTPRLFVAQIDYKAADFDKKGACWERVRDRSGMLPAG
jgi:hypothetical protein